MQDEYREYVTFTVKTAAGADAEMAVVEEFEFDGRNYVAAAQIADDTLKEDGVFLYRVKKTTDFAVEQITSRFEYREVSEAYLELVGGEQPEREEQ